jgi:hypothetical protein
MFRCNTNVYTVYTAFCQSFHSRAVPRRSALPPSAELAVTMAQSKTWTEWLGIDEASRAEAKAKKEAEAKAKQDAVRPSPWVD